MIVLLGIPPSLFFGLAGALAAAMTRNPPPFSPPEDNAPSPPSPVSAFQTVTLYFILFLSIVGYLSPVAVPYFTGPPIVAPAFEILPVKWRYQPPEGFSDAEADRIVVAALAQLAQLRSISLS